MLEALKKRYEAQVAEGMAIVNVYLKHPVGIGEHPQHIDEVNKQIEKIAAAREKLEVLEQFEPEKAVL